MITRILILHCEYCSRTTRVKGSGVTDDGLYRKAQERRWLIVRHPDPASHFTAQAACPACKRTPGADRHWAAPGVNRG